MPREKTFVPLTRGDLKALVGSVLSIAITERKNKRDPEGPKRKVRRFVLAAGKSVLDLVSALPEESITRCLVDGINREIYFNSGAGAKARIDKQEEKLRKQLALIQETKAKVDQEVE
jgi:hypothetical protein